MQPEERRGQNPSEVGVKEGRGPHISVIRAGCTDTDTDTHKKETLKINRKSET